MGLNPELLQEAESIWAENNKINRFGTRFGIYPIDKSKLLLDRSLALHHQLRSTSTPTTADEVLENELSRHLSSRAISLDNWLSGRTWTLENYLHHYGLQASKITALKDWLAANRAAALQGSEDLYRRFRVDAYELALPLEVPRLRDQAVGIGSNRVEIYHQALADLYSSVSDAGSYLRQLRVDVTTKNRSEFNYRSRRLGLSLGSILYENEDGSLQVRERELLRLYGHEGLAHALQYIITQASPLPVFLKENSGASAATEEALALHMEKVVFDEVADSPELQKQLQLTDRYPDIYEEVKATALVNTFKRRFYHYSIYVLADLSFGDPEDPQVVNRKTEHLSELAINPMVARNLIEDNRRHYDSQKNLDSDLLSELRYASPVVDEAFAVFAQNGLDYTSRAGRSLIDLTLLTGFFTPAGLLENAALQRSR
ncbi:hypothetical protein M1116_02275 [Patescibacteria group bacterium]|nr:hypothetical protein [Patescibacteria group bacterium]